VSGHWALVGLGYELQAFLLAVWHKWYLLSASCSEQLVDIKWDRHLVLCSSCLDHEPWAGFPAEDGVYV
jgi:hypothetical protein